MFNETSYNRGLGDAACEQEVSRRRIHGYLFRGDRVRFTATSSGGGLDTFLPTGYSRDTMNGLIAAAGFTNVQSKVDRSWGDLVITIEATALGDMTHHNDACSIFMSNVKRYFPNARQSSCGVIARVDVCGSGGLPATNPASPGGGGNTSGGGDTNGSDKGFLDDFLNEVQKLTTVGSIGLLAGAALVLIVLTRK